MGYINKITVGGEEYSLTPSFEEGLVYIESTADNFAGRPVRFMYASYGGLFPYLASPYADQKTERLFSIDVKGRGPAWGLGANMYGAMGVYIYTDGASPMIQDGDTKSQLGRLGLTNKGAIGVYITGDDGIYTNNATGCIGLKLKTEPVPLQSGELLRIYINPDGCLELVKI